MRSVKLFWIHLFSFILKDFKVFKVFKEKSLMFLDDKKLPLIQIPVRQSIQEHGRRVSPF